MFLFLFFILSVYVQYVRSDLEFIVFKSTYCGRNLMLRFFGKLICLLVH